MGRINTTYFIYLYLPDFDISGLDNITISIPSIAGYSFTPEFYTYNTSGSFITTETSEITVVENRLTTSYLKVVYLSDVLLDRLKESFYNPVIIQTFSQVDINFLQPQFTGSINSQPPVILNTVNSFAIETLTPQFTGSVNSQAPLLVTTISKVEINGVI